MGAVIQNGNFVGGLDAAVAAKIGTATLNTSADDLSGAINEHEEDIIALRSSSIHIMMSKKYEVTTSTTKGNIIGGYVGELSLTDIPSTCVLVLPIGNARCSSDGGRYGVVGSYSPDNVKNTRWFINSPTNEKYTVYFAYFYTDT
jgi:hypothetical protein